MLNLGGFVVQKYLVYYLYFFIKKFEIDNLFSFWVMNNYKFS